MSPAPDVDRLAASILHRLADMFALGPVPSSTVDEPVFLEESYRVAGRSLDSVDVIELIVQLETDFGIRLLDRGDLTEAATLRGLAELVAFRADALAIARFCRSWPPVTDGLS
ncbi:MAG TPA: acyl carrier protein [Acidimicrobiales bacterium]